MMNDVMMNKFVNHSMYSLDNFRPCPNIDWNIPIVTRNSTCQSIKRNISLISEFSIWPKGTRDDSFSCKPFNPFFGFDNNMHMWDTKFHTHFINEPLNF